MSDSTETVEIAVDDLLELSAIAAAGEYVSLVMNADDPNPAWEAAMNRAQTILDHCFHHLALEDEEFERHPAVGEVWRRSSALTADVLQAMLDDKDEHLQMAGLFDYSTHCEGSWPLPFDQVRRGLRRRVKDLRALTAASQAIAGGQSGIPNSGGGDDA